MNIEKLKRYNVYGENECHGTIIDEASEGEFVKYSDLVKDIVKDYCDKEEKTYPVEFTESELRYMTGGHHDNSRVKSINRKAAEVLKKIDEQLVEDGSNDYVL